MTGIHCAVIGDRAGLPPGRDATVDAELSAALGELRLIRDAWEVGQLQLAVDHTAAGFEDVVRALPSALAHPRGERWIEGVFGLASRASSVSRGWES